MWLWKLAFSSHRMDGDREKSVKLLKDVQENCKDIVNHVNDLSKRAEHGEFNTTKGISFLEVKYQMLLTYLINLTFVMMKKCRGEQIKDDPAIDRLVEIRTVLEKIRPIDQKLKYQIDKVIQLAATGGKESNDPMRFKANPDSLESKLENESSGSEDSSEEGEDKERKDSKLYRPPKLATAHFDDETKLSRLKKQMEHAKKRALDSDIIQDLRNQYDEGPEEIRETQDVYRLREDKKRKERTQFEEDNFVRLLVTKKDKHTEKRMATMSSLANLTQFGNLNALDVGEGDVEFGAKRRKVTSGKSGKKGKGKKGKKGSQKKKKFH